MMGKTILIMFVKMIWGFILLAIGGITALFNIMIAISQGTTEPILQTTIEMAVLVCVCGIISGAVLAVYGLRTVHDGAMYTNTKHYRDTVIKKVVEVMKARETCKHESMHQVGFTNLIKCNECGETFENLNFMDENSVK